MPISNFLLAAYSTQWHLLLRYHSVLHLARHSLQYPWRVTKTYCPTSDLRINPAEGNAASASSSLSRRFHMVQRFLVSRSVVFRINSVSESKAVLQPQILFSDPLASWHVTIWPLIWRLDGSINLSSPRSDSLASL
jgi:hypothetical protein